MGAFPCIYFCSQLRPPCVQVFCLIAIEGTLKCSYYKIITTQSHSSNIMLKKCRSMTLCIDLDVNGIMALMMTCQQRFVFNYVLFYLSARTQDYHGEL